MSRTKLVSVIALCLVISVPAALAASSGDGQQARDHANEVRQLKERTRAHDEARRHQAEHDRQKLKEHKKLKEDVDEQAEHEQGREEDHGNDDDAVDGTD